MLQKHDLRILAELKNDSNRSRKSIANQIITDTDSSGNTRKLSESALSKHISRLKDDGIIKRFSIDLDYKKLGYHTHAITLIDLKDQKFIPELSAHISKINEAIEVFTTLGDHDIFVRWLCRDNSQLINLIKDALSGQQIDKFVTITLAEESKREAGPSLITKNEPH